MEGDHEAAAGKPIRCKAAVCRAAEEPLRIEEVVVAPPRHHEVRIKILCTSLCHSDLTFWRLKEFPHIFPIILGHEAYGVVESVGEGVRGVAEGDTVLPVFLGGCGGCRDCRSDRSNMCEAYAWPPTFGMPRDRSSRFSGGGGEEIHHVLCVSSFAEYTVVDEDHVVKVDPMVPPQIACLLGCGVGTGIGAAWKAAAVEQGSTVAIFGLGTVGMAVKQLQVAVGARRRGAAKIIGVDLNLDRFELGKQFGLTDFVDPNSIGEKPISEVIKEMTDGGRGADYCFECVGVTSLMNDAFQSTRKGLGKTIILGLESHRKQLCLDPKELLRGGCIMGSLFGGMKPKQDIPVLVQEYLNKELVLDGFATHEVGFQDINKAFDLMIKGESLRCTIWMDR